MRIGDWSSDVCSSDLVPQVHFDFDGAASEDGGTAAGTEKPPGVVACFAVDRHRILREHRGRVKQGPMMLAAVETVTKADPVWASRRHKSDVAAQAAAGESLHAAPPLEIGRAHSELQSLMRISYAVFCLKKKKKQYTTQI